MDICRRGRERRIRGASSRSSGNQYSIFYLVKYLITWKRISGCVWEYFRKGLTDERRATLNVGGDSVGQHRMKWASEPSTGTHLSASRLMQDDQLSPTTSLHDEQCVWEGWALADPSSLKLLLVIGDLVPAMKRVISTWVNWHPHHGPAEPAPFGCAFC